MMMMINMTCCIKITINSYYTVEKYSRTMNERKRKRKGGYSTEGEGM